MTSIFRSPFNWFASLGTGFFLSACGGGGASPAPTLPPPTSPAPPPVVAPDFSAVVNEVNRHPVTDMVLIVGDETGPIFSYEKGTLATSDTIRLASASKLLTGLGVWSLVEDGVLSETDHAADLVADWPTDAPDVTVGQLLSFTSGFDQPPRAETCAGRATISLGRCVEEIVSGGSDSPPGSRFAYGPEHMQVAALLAREASGERLNDTVRRAVFDAVGATAEAGFPAYENARYSGNASASAEDYGLVLQGVLSGTLVADQDALTRDRTDGLPRAPGTVQEGDDRDWHYGFGFWIECDALSFEPDCATDPTISSPGAFGTVPWIDFEAGYWAILAMDEIDAPTPTVVLEQTIQPMIVEALGG